MVRPSPISEAARWIELLVTGSLGTSLAVLAIAFVGFALLHGRIPTGRAIRVAIGCFILFAAPSIAHGVIEAARNSDNTSARGRGETSPAAPQNLPLPQFDPYAGATVPM